jgi:two-component system, LytTR family, sensor kinase
VKVEETYQGICGGGRILWGASANLKSQISNLKSLMLKRRLTTWLFIFVVGVLTGLYFAIQVYLQRAFENRPITLTQALLRGLVFWLLWAISSPLILWLARTFPIPRRDWLDALLFHLPAGFIFSLAHLLSYVFITSSLSNGSPPATFDGLLQEFQPVFISGFAWWSLVYWTILIASYAFEYYRRYQEGAIKASQLEAQLAQAQLQALKMQLHPHFLFNTLHSISALMREDVEMADQMIARLGDFLRLTLHNIGDQETTLKEELNFLRCYLEIEQIRFQDRLTTLIDVDPASMEARVPNLFLQPIVENAIRHGIAPQKGRGTIAIRAGRSNGRLKVQVQDNGPGLRPHSHGMKGVGLANTRARLHQLYGDDHLLELTNVIDGGLVVNLEIPFSDAKN